MLKTDDFDFHLPEKSIAKQPFFPKELTKMLVFNNNNISDNKIKDLIDYLQKGDVVVFNDTKVIKAKLKGRRYLDNNNYANIEINLHKNIDESSWQVMARPAKRLKIDQEIKFADDFMAKILKKHDNGFFDLKFNVKSEDFFDKLEKYGQMPLPPYIKRGEEDKSDQINYQTIFAKNKGAVAAPTAGLHFTKEILEKIQNKGVKQAFVTLNVGAGTFLPVKSEFIKDHQMHEEYFTINQETCDIINEAKKNNKKIVAIGTTSLRVLESAADENGQIQTQSRDTDIFIYPPYRFKIVDILMTNFHLPKSTLFMLICAFIGKENAQKIYNHAVKNQYRFYSYGDACLFLPK
ncbi:tRNA preQ1(34) S-adenosylmethionine ribosyltransferase-isomerase QueA [Rickettsiales bacterium]|nr:tRNA preQ1(34) S-adenosylmethionine ribosyltransferase-isomerase QueA [Rickettsiales bacterium]